MVISFFNAGVPWANHVAESLRTNLESESPYSIDLHIEFADLVYYNDETYRQKLIDLYRYKYSHPKMDLVIGMGDEEADFLSEYGEDLFGKIPKVIVSVNPNRLQRDSLQPNMTSLVWEADIQGNIQLIEELIPKASHLYVISGSSETDRAAEKLVRKELQHYKGPLEINYVSNISKQDLLTKVARLPENSALFYTVFTRDATGVPVVSKRFVSTVSEKANAPVFGVLDSYLGEGIVGGNLLSAEEQGRKCADIAVRILKGEPPADIYPSRVLNHVMFDWRQLQRWRISEDRLPAGSIVQFKTPTPWELYHRYIIAVVLLILFGYGFISVLLVQRRRLRQSESETRARVALRGNAVCAVGQLCEPAPGSGGFRNKAGVGNDRETARSGSGQSV